jgi:hypothetical protein
MKHANHNSSTPLLHIPLSSHLFHPEAPRISLISQSFLDFPVFVYRLHLNIHWIQLCKISKLLADSNTFVEVCNRRLVGLIHWSGEFDNFGMFFVDWNSVFALQKC